MTSALRYEGYRNALHDAGISVLPELAISVERYRRADGAVAMADLMALTEPPDAVVCFNDVLAVGALSFLNQCGIRVPGQIAVAGFDNIDETPYSSPPLTTIAWDTKRIAEEAIRLLAERQGASVDLPPREISVGYTLMIRGSSSPANPS